MKRRGNIYAKDAGFGIWEISGLRAGSFLEVWHMI